MLKELERISNTIEMLAELYPSVEESRRIVTMAGCSIIHIEMSHQPFTNWMHIIFELNKQPGQIKRLYEIIERDYPEFTNNKLLTEENEIINNPAPSSSLKKFEGLISRLTKELSKIFINKEEILELVQQAGINNLEISLTDNSVENWRNILVNSMNEGSLIPIIETSLKAHPNSNVLLEAINVFYSQENEIKLSKTMNEEEILIELLEVLDLSFTGFNAQLENRNDLYARIRSRLKIEDNLPYEAVFAAYFEEMNRFEKRLHKNIREVTEYIKDKNARSRDLATQIKYLAPKIPKLTQLRKHLDLWLHKYETLFVKDPAMCILYTGVTEKLPFPKGVESDIRDYLDQTTSIF